MFHKPNPLDSTWRFAVMAILGGCLVLSGCSGLTQPPHRIEHYTLEYPPPAVADGLAVGKTLRVARFRAAPQYDSVRIFYRSGPFLRNPYEYHRWRVQPGEMIAFFLFRDLRASGLFDGVFMGETRAKTDLRLEGTVEELFEDDTGADRQAALSVTVTLLRDDGSARPDPLVLQKNYSARETCKNRSPQALVAAMSRAMARVSAGILADIDKALAAAGGP